MTDVLIGVALLLTAAAATAAVLNREPVRQALTLSFLGLALALLFTFVQAPDVALSQLAVGSAVTPLMMLLTVHKTRRRPEGAEHRGGDGDFGEEPGAEAVEEPAADGEPSKGPEPRRDGGDP